jgi:alkylhydroperoxidase family enzyme
MTWIKTLHESEWDEELESLRPKVTDPTTGQVDNIMSVHSLDVGSLNAHLALYSQAMQGTTTLPKVEREMIALVVSTENDCHY